MRTIQTAEPRRELREFVRSYAQREVVAGDLTLEQPGIASLEHILAFDLSARTVMEYDKRLPEVLPRINVVGSQTFPAGCAHFTGHIIAFGIFLAPSALGRLFGIRPAELANSNTDGEALFGRGMVRLWMRLAESKSFTERIAVAEDYLLPFALNATCQTPVVRSARHMFLHKGTIRVDELARQTGIGTRQFERQFIEQIGCAPKLFARITRFQAALDAKRKSPQRSWLSIAHQLGYFDQMHLIKDFHGLGNQTPSEIVYRTGDLQPWSLSGPSEIFTLGSSKKEATRPSRVSGGRGLRVRSDGVETCQE